MTYWIYVTNSENWTVTKKTNILGASAKHKNTFSRIKKGDKCLVYVKSETIDKKTIGPNIVAEYEIASNVFEDSKIIFEAPKSTPSESFPLRLLLAPQKLFKPPIEFKLLIPKLSFLPNKSSWTGPIRGKAMVQIPQSDYDTIISTDK